MNLMYNIQPMQAWLIYICWQEKESHLLFHPISGFLTKTKFKKNLHLMPLAPLPGG